MKSLSSLGIGLSLVVGCLLLALVAEIYYLLWWKKRSTNNREIEIEEGFKRAAKELFFHMFCWNKPQSLNSTTALMNPIEQDPQLQINSTSSKHFLLSPFFENSVETDLMALHNISAPPRFLFTIKEETKEDLESEDGKSRGDNKKSLRDLLLTVETPFFTPLSSPPFFTPPVTPLNSYNHHGFNPLFESSSEVELVMMNSIKSSSPPPKFKFLKEAEEKLYRRKLMEEAEKRVHETSSTSINSNGIEAVLSSSSSKGGNLGNGSSSPSTIRSTNTNPMFH